MLKKILFILILSLTIIVPGFSQKAGTKDNVSKIKDMIYTEIILEDFESTTYSRKDNLKIQRSRYQTADCKIRDSVAAPNGKSKKYLGIKLFAKGGDVLRIVPAKKLEIKKHCNTISVWVYGKNKSGVLYLVLQDAAKKTHLLRLCSTNFHGWKKATVKLTRRVNQEDEFLNQKRFMRILSMQYRPAKTTRRENIKPQWHYIYIDDISAMVREKYTDRQSDDW